MSGTNEDDPQPAVSEPDPPHDPNEEAPVEEEGEGEKEESKAR